MVTHSGGMHRDELGVSRQFGREEYDGQEDEQRTEHIHVIGQEGDVVVVKDLFERHLELKEIVHFLRQVKYDRNWKNEHDTKEKRAQKLPNNIPVEAFHVKSIVNRKSSNRQLQSCH